MHPLLPSASWLLHMPVAGLQPLAHGVLTKALLTQLRELAPSQTGPPPSHCTQPCPLARQIWPLQGAVQQTSPLDCVASHALELQSVAPAQAWPTGDRHWPATNVSLGSGQTQDPSIPHTLPVAAQPGVQQRCTPVTSRSHELDAH